MMPHSFANVVQGIRNPENLVHNTASSSENDQFNHSLVDNNSHPLYLHNNDHPGLVLIAKKLLGPDNYGPWSRSMRIALNARNKFVIVSGSFEKPAEDSPLLPQWERVNDMIITWILNTVADDISDGLSYVTTAKEVWNELLERFSGTNGYRIYQILKDTHGIDQGTRAVKKIRKIRYPSEKSVTVFGKKRI